MHDALDERTTLSKVVCLSVVLVMTLGWVPPLSATPLEEETTVLIANKSVGDDSLKQADVQRIFLGKQTRWGDKKKIVVSTLKKGDTHSKFLKSFVKKTSKQFKNYWKKQVFTGKGKAPKSFKSEKDLAKYVASTKGAVGYVKESVAKKLGTKVKVINVK